MYHQNMMYTIMIPGIVRTFAVLRAVHKVRRARCSYLYLESKLMHMKPIYTGDHWNAEIEQNVIFRMI